MIKDARHIYGRLSAEDMASFVGEQLDARGLSPIEGDRVVVAYVNLSRWVADCPECNGGIGVWEDLARGMCLDCGHVYVVEWPTPAAHAAGEEALSARSTENDRNWFPATETPEDLVVENEVHAAIVAARAGEA